MSPVLVLLLANPTVAAGTSITIADYPRYGTNVAALDPRVQADLRRFASGLVGAALAGQSVDVTVIGHADFDAQGRAFELGVSRERAAGAETALEAFFIQAADAAQLAPDKRKLVRLSAIGVGTQRPVFSPPANEEQRKANRRVDLVFTATPVVPPDPLAKYRECIRVLGSASPPGPARRMSCVCNLLLRTAPVAKDYFYDFQAARQARAGAAAMSQFTPDQMSSFYRTFMLFIRQSIAQTATASASDADLRTGLIELDDSIGRNLADFLAQAEQGAGPFERSVSVDIVKRMQDTNHTYSCYAGYSRRDPNR